MRWLEARAPGARSVPAASRLAAALAALALAGAPALAGTPAGYTEYVIPFDEDIFVFVTDPLAFDAIPADRPTSAIVSLTVWSDATTIYVDHWENGYSFDPDDPDATADEKYSGNLGETLSFVSDPIPRPRTGADGNTYVGTPGNCDPQAPPKTPVFRNTTVFCYDGRDYVYAAGGATTMTRGGWIEGSGGNTLGPRAAIGEEVYPLAPQLIRYVLPFGEGSGGSSYERVIAVIQATQDDTQLRLDFDGDGTFDAFNTENGYRTPRVDPVDATVLTLQRGESYVLDRDSDGVGGLLAQDAIILGSRTLQVEYLYGEDDGAYDTRAVAAYPRGFWGRNYYAVVDGAPGGADTDILLYNPSLTDAITITWRTLVGNGTFTLTPQESAFFEAKTGGYVPEGSAVYLSGTDRWWGFSDIDANSAAYDWGYSLMPDNLLEDEQTVAYAPGNIENDDPLDFPACDAAEGRADGIFVTPAFDNTTFFIDKDGDDIPDSDASIEVLIGTAVQTATSSGGYVGNRLESLYITGSNVGTTAASDCDLTGARVWATGPFTMAYGQNPEEATPAGGLDLGYTVLPNPGDWMELVLTVDKSTNPVVLSTAAGATATYTLVIRSHDFDVDSLSVVDTLPTGWEYVAGSTTITLPNLTQSNTDPTVSLPTLTWPSGLFGSLLTNQQITITFQARTTAAFDPGELTRNLVEATGTRTVGGTPQTFNARDFVFNTYQDTGVSLGITKTSSVPEATPVSPQDTLTYTVEVQNPPSSTVPLTGVWIADPLPPGVSYVPASGLVSGCHVDQNVRDEFGTISYANDDGSQAWATTWAETDALGGGALSGAVSVASGALRFAAVAATVFVRDQFDTAGDGFGNDGSVDWANGWTESGDDGDLGSGDLEVETTGRLEFQGGADAGDFFARDVTIAGATTATVSFDFEDAASNISGFDDAVVEYSVDGGGFTTLFTMNQGDPHTNYSTSFPVSGTTLTLRFRLLDDIEGGDLDAFDDVQVIHDGVGGQSVRDEFDTASSGAGDDGTASWAGDWTETGDDGNFATGQIEIEQGRLEFQANSDANDSVQRDVTITGATSATVSFRFADNGSVEPNDDVVVEYQVDGGGFATLFTLDGASANTGYLQTVPVSGTTFRLRIRLEDDLEGGEEIYFDDVQVVPNRPGVGGSPAANDRVARSVDLSGAASPTLTFTSATSGTLDAGDVFEVRVSSTGSFAGSTSLESVSGGGAFAGSYDLTPYASASTTVFFVVAGGVDTVDEWRSFDDVEVAFTTARAAFASGFPPDVLSASEGCVLPPGSSVTLTFDVTVDDPFPTGQDEIVNVASSAAAEIPIPQSASARNLVLVPGAGSATVGDRVWLDADADGVLDPGEAGLAGVEVTLRDLWGTPVQVATSDSQGRYLFVDVEPGSGYFVEVTGGLAAGLTQTTDGRTDLRTDDFDLVDGQDHLDADIGFRAATGTAAIGDSVWVDTDVDSIRDPGEVGLGGITVELYEDSDGNGTGDVLVATQLTGPGGAYLFSSFTANGALDYVVSVPTGQPALAGYTTTTPTSYSYVDLPGGSSRVDADFGFLPPGGTAFIISDGIWLDDGSGGGTASNGVRDGAEAGIAGVTVSLLDAGGNQIATATSGASGQFSFLGVLGGQNYTWRITDDANVLADLFGTTSFAVAGREQLVGDLSAHVDHTASPHFGYDATRSIGDTVWNDLDGDGAQQPGEPGIAGVTVLLYEDVDADGVFEPGGDDGGPVASVATSGAGFYLFAGLSDGTYWVGIDGTQAGLSSFDTLTTGDQEGAAGHQRRVTLAGGASRLAEDFGYRATTAFELSGRLWNDADDDGVDDAEPGFGNVTMELVSGGTVVATATSAANGRYGFQGLPNGGAYTVRFTDVNGVLTGFDTTYERTEGALAAGYDGQEVATISGASVTDIDFGFFNPNRLLTLAIVSSFAAHEEAGAVVVEWTTSAEIGTIGFDLYRYERDGWVLVSDGLLPALLGRGQSGGTYRFVDETASPRRWYWYLLVEAEASGARNPIGPYRVNTRATAGSDDGEERRAALGHRLARRFAASDRVDRERLETRGRRGRGRKPLRSTEGERRGRSDRKRGGAGPGATHAVKIAVEEAGVHFVSRAELEAAGLEVGRRGRPHLRRGSERLSLQPSRDESGFYFYARDPGSSGGGRDVYWISDSGRGEWMDSRSDARARPRESATFARTLALEEDRMPTPEIFGDPEGDFTLWDYTFGGWPAKSFGFRADAAVGAGRASVTVRLVGGNDTPADPDHHVVLRVNGQTVGEVTLDGLEALETTHEFDASLLADGENSLELQALADTGAWYSLVWLDSFEVRYESEYRAYEDRLECSSEDNRSVLISGFSRPDILVFDVTDPDRPVAVEGRVQELDGGSWGVALRPPARGTVYAALTPDAARTGELTPDRPSELRSRRNAAEYLVITTPELADAARTLALHRDMPSMVVDVEDVYDEFNDGVPSPHAIRAFLAHARARWSGPPRYVVLAGSGTFDYRAAHPYGGNLIPPAMVVTPDGLAPSDVWFADLDPSTPAPELAIGRLPASTPEELEAIVRKILAREQGAGWLGRMVVVSDDPDAVGDFPSDNERLAALAPPGFEVERIDLSRVPVATARQQLLAALEEGRGLVSYVGHAGYDRLSDEGLLRSTDLATLSNAERPAVVTALTCLAGNFASPFIGSIGENLVLAPRGGAAAVWAPTWLSDNEHAVALGEQFYAAAFASGDVRIGDVALAAARGYDRTWRPDYIFLLYTLLGDPAMPLGR